MHDHHSNSAFLDDIPADAPVLVCVVTRVADFDRIRAGWYRVPLDRARVPLTASYLAFYQTAAAFENTRMAASSRLMPSSAACASACLRT